VHGRPADVVARISTLMPVCKPARTGYEACYGVRNCQAQRIARVGRRTSPGSHHPTYSPRGHEIERAATGHGVMRIEQFACQSRSPISAAGASSHDVGEQHRGKNPIIGHVCLLAGEELSDVLE